jgi:alpha-L-fucosidase
MQVVQHQPEPVGPVGHRVDHRGDNLLLNVGPDGAGHIPDLQQRPLRELGAWLDRNGDAIYATRPWTPTAGTTATGEQVRYTQEDGTVYAIVLSDDLTGRLTIRDLALRPARTRPDHHHILMPAGHLKARGRRPG